MLFFKRYKIKRLTKKLKSLQQQRIHSQPDRAALVQEKSYYHQLANIYQSLVGKKKYPFAFKMVLACYRASAVLEDSEAQYFVAKHLIEEARFNETLEREGVFANTSNEKQMKLLYEEGLAYLNSAVSLNHILAQRLLGLCYINGWGVAVDQDHGFEFIVASIEKEGKWDKVPQIFASIGLNKPEFYTALMKQRKV